MTGREGGEQMEEGKKQQWEVEKKNNKKKTKGHQLAPDCSGRSATLEY